MANHTLPADFTFIDGVETPVYDAVVEDSIHFSPDSMRVAYAAKKAGKGIVVVDDKEFPSDELRLRDQDLFSRLSASDGINHRASVDSKL